MKAKEIVELYKNDPTEKGLFQALNQMHNDLDNLVKIRKPKTNPAWEAIYKELINKWRIVCQLEPRLKINWFYLSIKETTPKIYELLQDKNIIPS